MTGPHLTPERDRERAFALWCAHQNLVEDETTPHGEAFSAGWAAALDVEREALNQARTALADGAATVARNLAAISHRFGPTTFVRELDQWAQEAQRVLGLAVAEADKPHHGNEL